MIHLGRWDARLRRVGVILSANATHDGAVPRAAVPGPDAITDVRATTDPDGPRARDALASIRCPVERSGVGPFLPQRRRLALMSLGEGAWGKVMPESRISLDGT